MAKLLSVNVGLPREVTWNGKTVRTAVWKFPLEERRMVRKLNIEGDARADLVGHGGEHRAVFVYQMDSYHYWERFLGRSDFTFGQFGENFTVEGLRDEDVCVGDRYRNGNAIFEVTQPRVTCYRVGIRMSEPRMPALLVAHHRPGFYFRVLQEGEVGADDDIVKVADGPERVTVADMDGSPTNVQFMVKDSSKYASTGGWGFAQFKNGKPDADEATLKKCFSCHEPFKARDFVFTHYAP